MNESSQIQSGYIGIDVSKLTPHVSSITESGLHYYEQVENSKQGCVCPGSFAKDSGRTKSGSLSSSYISNPINGFK